MASWGKFPMISWQKDKNLSLIYRGFCVVHRYHLKTYSYNTIPLSGTSLNGSVVKGNPSRQNVKQQGKKGLLYWLGCSILITKGKLDYNSTMDVRNDNTVWNTGNPTPTSHWIWPLWKGCDFGQGCSLFLRHSPKGLADLWRMIEAIPERCEHKVRPSANSTPSNLDTVLQWRGIWVAHHVV